MGCWLGWRNYGDHREMLTRLAKNRCFDRRCAIRSKRAAGFAALTLVAMVYVYLNNKSFAWYRHATGEVGECHNPHLTDLQSLIRDLHHVLDELSLTHFLLYGSLFGALRHNDPLPWDNDVDIGLLQSEMRQVDESKFYAAFKTKNIAIYYRPWFGTYRVTRGKARGDLMVFRKAYSSDFMCRTGIETWIFFLNHNRYHMFPARLIEKPLPTAKFAGTEMPVPNEGLEMQKYFYPDDWHIEVKPKGCA